jgi:hypothetical protein
MSLSFPRAFIDLCTPVSGVTDLKRFQASAFDGDGGIGSVDLAPAVWRSQYNITARGREAIGQWRAWFSSLRGGMRSFQGIPIRDGRKLYRWPLTRPRGFDGLTVSGSPWAGSGTLTAIGAGKDTITLGDMPNGLVLSPGDFLSFSDGTVNHLHMILEGGTVSSNSISLTVEPTIRQDVDADVSPAITCQFERPWCDMYIAGEVSESGDMAVTTFSFTAYQKPR